jgi:hypothetical protein
MMLKKEVNFIPISPKKSNSGSSHVRAQSTPLTSLPSTPKLNSGFKDTSTTYTPVTKILSRLGSESESWAHLDEMGWMRDGNTRALTAGSGDVIRTTEEKKNILGGMLGNVDALVEGVRKAGIWGLG